MKKILMLHIGYSPLPVANSVGVGRRFSMMDYKICVDSSSRVSIFNYQGEEHHSAMASSHYALPPLVDQIGS